MKKYPKIISFLPLILVIIALAWRLIGINAQGETWDEIAYFDAGKNILHNLRKLDFNSADWDINKEHPPIGKYIYAAVSFPSYIHDSRDFTNGRVASAIMGALTILIVFYLAKDLFSIEVAALSALILTFLPDLVGLNKVLGLDSPTLLFFTLTIFLFIRACKKLNHNFFLLSGLSLGLAIGTRFNNFILFILLPIIFLLIFGKDSFQKKRIYLIYLLITPAIALLFLYLSWPWLWTNTLTHLASSFHHWGAIKELFLGQVRRPGYDYYLVYLGVTTPVAILLLLVPFFIQSFRNKNINNWLILAWFLASFLIAFSPTKQNGIRYMVIIYPALAIMASKGFFYLFQKKDSLIFGSLFILYLLIININYYPYYLTYYNEIVGGTGKVYQNKLFPIGWWGEGLEEASIWVSDHAQTGAKVDIQAIPNHTTGGKLRSDLVQNSDNPDYIIVNLNSLWVAGTKIPTGYHLVKTIKSDKVPFVQIYGK